MYNFSNDEKNKMRLVIKYITSNYEPGSKMTELQHARLIKFIKLISYKYGVVGYNFETVEDILDNGNIVKITSNDSVYGSKYKTIHEIERYDGQDLTKEELTMINNEIVKTEVMKYNKFREYVYNELEKL